MFQWIYNKLIEKRNQERYKVMRLEWQKSELERKIAIMKGNKKDI